jgi:hypothetical protein
MVLVLWEHLNFFLVVAELNSDKDIHAQGFDSYVIPYTHFRWRCGVSG